MKNSIIEQVMLSMQSWLRSGLPVPQDQVRIWRRQLKRGKK